MGYPLVYIALWAYLNTYTQFSHLLPHPFVTSKSSSPLLFASQSTPLLFASQSTQRKASWFSYLNFQVRSILLPIQKLAGYVGRLRLVFFIFIFQFPRYFLTVPNLIIRTELHCSLFQTKLICNLFKMGLNITCAMVELTNYNTICLYSSSITERTIANLAILVQIILLHSKQLR